MYQSLSHVQFLQPHGRQPTRLLCSGNSLGKNTGVGCHFLLQWISPPRDRTQLLNCRWILYCLNHQRNLMKYFFTSPNVFQILYYHKVTTSLLFIVILNYTIYLNFKKKKPAYPFSHPLPLPLETSTIPFSVCMNLAGVFNFIF